MVRMKPETIERRARERVAERAARKADLIARLRAKVEAGDPDGIYAELLAEVQS